MSRIVRKQAKFDQELDELSQSRIYRCDFVDSPTGLVPIYRELVIANQLNHSNRTPWWKRQNPKARRAKKKTV